MHRIRLTSALTFALFLLAACAPTTVGSRATPYDLRSGESAQVAPGGTVYAELRVPASEFGLSRDDLPGLFVPCGGERECLVVTRLFEVVDAAIPVGWAWRVDRASAVARPRSDTSLEILLRLDVPAGARLGGTALRARVRASTGVERPVALVVQVIR
jgi:hypothetical protein